MNSEARIDLASEDFVLSTSRKSHEGLNTFTARSMRSGELARKEVWQLCTARLAPHWARACEEWSAKDQQVFDIADFDVKTNQYLAGFNTGLNIRRHSVESSSVNPSVRLDEDLFTVLNKAVGLTSLLKSSLMRDRSSKCLESVRNLSDCGPLSSSSPIYPTPVQSAGEHNTTSDRTQHLYCVGLRYLLPLAVAIEDFGADGVYGCAAAMREIALSYNLVAYHNGAHAALVTHQAVEISKLSGLWNCLDDRERVAVVLASAGHDIGHPGIGASLFLKIGHPLSVIYNDKHVLENYHAAHLIQILRKHNYLPSCTNSASDLKSMIIQCVLWTDLIDHSRVMLAVQDTMSIIRKSRKRGQPLSQWLMQKTSKAHLRDLAGLVLKIADLSYFALSDPRLMIEWAIWLYAEIYSQRQIEADNNLPLCEVHGLNGLGTRKWFEANLNFCDDVLMPMTISLASFESRLKHPTDECSDPPPHYNLTLSTEAVKILAEEKAPDWRITALALRQRDNNTNQALGLTTVSAQSPSPTVVKSAARWLAQQSNSVKRKSTAAIQSLLEPDPSSTTMGASMTKSSIHQAVIVPLQNNMELLKKAKYAN